MLYSVFVSSDKSTQKMQNKTFGMFINFNYLFRIILLIAKPDNDIVCYRVASVTPGSRTKISFTSFRK